MPVDQPSPSEMTLAGVMAALSDPARVEIVRVLAAEGERTCGTFDLGLSKATRSHHFKVLRESGLTHTRAAGTHRHVSLRRSDLEERFPGLLAAVLAAAEQEAAGRGAPRPSSAVLAAAEQEAAGRGAPRPSSSGAVLAAGEQEAAGRGGPRPSSAVPA